MLNTCHIRERASEKIYSELGKIRELKDERASAGRETTLVVAGCVAQAEGAEILRRQPAVDLVVGPQNYHRLPQLLRAKRRGAGAVDTEFPLEDKFDHLPASAPEAIRARGVSAFVTVQEGCDKFCSFCVVPYTRGGEVSRPLAKVLAEIERLAAGRRRRNHPDRPERQRLSRPRAKAGAAPASPISSPRRPKFPACCGFAMRLRTRTT